MCTKCNLPVETLTCNTCIKLLADTGIKWVSKESFLTGYAATTYSGKLWDVEEHNRKKLMKSIGSSIGSSIKQTPIPTELYNRLNYLGLIPSSVRDTHVGQSDYSSKLVQPWTIFLDNPELNYMECDVIKRIIRTNTRDTRLTDLTKCKHIIDELIRQIDTKEST